MTDAIMPRSRSKTMDKRKLERELINAAMARFVEWRAEVPDAKVRRFASSKTRRMLRACIKLQRLLAPDARRR